MFKVKYIFISPGHNFYGNHGKPAGTHVVEASQEVDCVAGRGIKGDRFFDYKESYKGQITFFSHELFLEMSKALSVEGKEPEVLRRNVITEGIDLNELIGVEFELQGVSYLGVEECSPCYWMNEAFGPGAEDFLKGRGGLRCKILSDGKLKVDT